MPASFTFGSTAGLDLALVFFAGIASVLGAAAYTFARRARIGRGAASTAGIVVGLAVTALVYVSSFGGFHTLRVGGDGLVRIAGLHGVGGASMPAAAILTATARPAFKSQWRLVIVTVAGEEFHSKPADSATVAVAAARLGSLVGSQ